MDNDAWQEVARHARRLGLTAESIDEVDVDRLRDFCEEILRELAARGLIAGVSEAGCYARPRERSN